MTLITPPVILGLPAPPCTTLYELTIARLECWHQLFLCRLHKRLSRVAPRDKDGKTVWNDHCQRWLKIVGSQVVRGWLVNSMRASRARQMGGMGRFSLGQSWGAESEKSFPTLSNSKQEVQWPDVLGVTESGVEIVRWVPRWATARWWPASEAGRRTLLGKEEAGRLTRGWCGRRRWGGGRPLSRFFTCPSSPSATCRSSTTATRTVSGTPTRCK